MRATTWRRMAMILVLAGGLAAFAGCKETGSAGDDAGPGSDTTSVGDTSTADTGGGSDDTGGMPPDAGDTETMDSAADPDTGTEDSGRPDTSDTGSDADAGSMTERCGELPMPSGSTTRLGPDRADELRQVVQNAQSGSTILLEKGTYSIGSQIQFDNEDVTLRSVSGNPEDVVLDGNYNPGEILAIHASDVTIAHLTVKRAENHAIHITPPSGGPDATGVRLYDLRLIDHGEQFVKVNPPGSDDAWADDGLLACSYLEMTDQGRPNVERNPGGCYTGGLDAHAARGWTVRDNTFEGIYCVDEGLAEHAVHFWTASRDNTVVRNVINNCARGIGFGLIENKDDARTYDDDPYPNAGYIGHYGGAIRNNFIWAGLPQMDTGIQLAQTRGATIRHNTIFTTSSARSRLFTSIGYRFSNTDVTISHNLVEDIRKRNGAKGTVENNVTGASADMFQDPSTGDLHLKAGASAAIDKAEPSDEVTEDIDGDMRPIGDKSDMGADEFQP